MKKFVGTLLIVLLLTGLMTPVNSSYAADTLKVGVSIPSADHGWTGGVVWWAQKAIDDWKAKASDVEFFLVTSDSAAKQVGDVEDLMVKEIDALVILPHDSAPLTPVVEEVYNKGIYTVVVDRGLTKEAQHVYVAGDNPGFGRVAGEVVAKELGGKGKVVALEGIPCVINTERVEAFKEIIKKYPDIELLDSQPAYWQTQKGLEVMENYLQKYDHIDAVWAGDDDVLKGVLQAYKESGRDDVKLFVGGGGEKTIVKRIMDGDPTVRATVTYPPNMLATAVSLAVMGLKGEKLNEHVYQNKIPSKIILASELIMQDNAAKYYVPESVY